MLTAISQMICVVLWRFGGRRLIAGPRLVTVVAILIASSAFIAAAGAHPSWLTVPALLALSIGFTAGSRLLALALVTISLAFWGYAWMRCAGPGADDISRLSLARACVFRGEVVSLVPKSTVSVTRALVAPYQVLFPTNRKVSGLTMLAVRGTGFAIAVGDRIEVKSHLISPPERQYPWEFDSREYLRRRGVHCLALAGHSEVKLLGGQVKPAKSRDFLKWFGQSLDGARARLISVHRRYAGEIEGDLLSAMVLGDRAVSLPPSLKDRFRDAGLSHLLAASGFNLTIVVGMTWWLGRWIVRSSLAANALSFLSMLLFVCLAGPSPSVMRAALMCSLLLSSRCLFRSSSVTAALAGALLVTLLLDPSSITDVGLQLSYVATFGIICGAQPLAAWLLPVRQAAVLRWLAEAVAVVLVAQLSILPLQLTYFFQVGVLFLPANLLVALAVPFATALGFISSACVLNESTASLAAPIAATLDWLAAYPVRWILFIADSISGVESSKLTLGPPPLMSAVLYCAAFFLFLLSLRGRQYRPACLCLLVVAFVGLLWRAPLPPLTVATFPGAVVIIDADRRAVCLGDCSGKSVLRFLSYHGVKPLPGTGSNFKIQVSGMWTTVESVSPPASILVGSLRSRWQPPEAPPQRLAAVLILRPRKLEARAPSLREPTPAQREPKLPLREPAPAQREPRLSLREPTPAQREPRLSPREPTTTRPEPKLSFRAKRGISFSDGSARRRRTARRETAARSSRASNLFAAAWDLATHSQAGWLVFDSGRWRRTRATQRSPDSAVRPEDPSVAFLGGDTLVLVSSENDPSRLRPYSVR